MSEREYIILPAKGFKSPEMKAIDPRGRRARTSSAGPSSVQPPGGGPTVTVVDSISPDGPKAALMSPDEAKEFRRVGQYRVVPVRKYRPARRPFTAISLKALSQMLRGNRRTQLRIFVKESGTDRPLADVTVIAIVNQATNAGLRRRTGASGQATLTFPQDAQIQQLFIYPPPGYWGKYLKNPRLEEDEDIYLNRIADNYPDLLRQTFKTPRPGHGKGVRVAVVDTGVDIKHPALPVKTARNCVTGEEPDDLAPSDGHGTHVAGIIAGQEHGIAPDVELYSYKVFPHSGQGKNLYISRGIDQAVKDGCDLINLSLYGVWPDELLRESIGDAFEHGSVCVVAAGNARRSPVAYPAWFKRSLAVSAIGKVGSYPDDALEAGEISKDRSSLDSDLYFASFSNFGREIDLCAPGVGIVSTWLGGGYAVENGTSMACPIVTGAGAALLSADKQLLSMSRSISRSLAIVQRIQSSCKSVGLSQTFEGLGQPTLE